MGDIEEGKTSLPDTLQAFLSNVSVVNVRGSHKVTGDSPSIFESNFDLTMDRLKYVFDMFDTDDDGRISYDSLRKGLDLHTASDQSNGSALDDKSFQQLVQHLDLDGSGDIDFDEFCQGIQLYMLRDLFQRTTTSTVSDSVEVMDYENVRFERHQVRYSKESKGESTIAASDFYFQDRPNWVKVRWIDVTASPNSTSTMKLLAVKHLLHPLALEDALSPAVHRAKAEVYKNHFFIMVPIFYINREPVPEVSKSLNAIKWCWKGCPKRRRTESSRQQEQKQILSSIGIHMASIFVNIPESDTMITFMVQDKGESVHAWQRTKEELELSYSKLRQYDAQYLTYALLDEAVDSIDPIISSLRSEVEEELEYLRSNGFDSLARMHLLKSEIEKVSRNLKPFMRLLEHVIEDDCISPGATVYLRDVLDNLEGSDESVNQLVKECEAVDDEAEKYQSRRMDKTLYTLTVISAVFLPAQFLTGVWGMNFVNMPELEQPWGYRMFWGLAAGLMVITLVVLNFGRIR